MHPRQSPFLMSTWYRTRAKPYLRAEIEALLRANPANREAVRAALELPNLRALYRVCEDLDLSDVLQQTRCQPATGAK